MSSKFLNVSPRAYIRQKDSKNVLPRIVRTGYQNELGVLSSSFLDRQTVVFTNNTRVLAPYMLPVGNAIQSGFDTGTLFVTASIRDRAAYFDSVVINDSIFPYKEGGNPAAFNTAEKIGFPEDEYPGFSSPDADKTAIVIDITSQADAVVTKLNRAESLRDPAGPFYGDSYTGFLYYDKVLKIWTDVGLTDPVKGTSTKYDPTLKLDHAIASTAFIVNDGDERLMCQFSSSPYSFTTETPFQVDTLFKSQTRGYDKIGEPTSFFGAPHSPRYHAKKNKSISLSDYITEPFVVDRISVKLPVRAYRTQSPPTIGSGPNIFDNGFAHDIDNYVFFVYLQNRGNCEKDSMQDVSSSIRHLIGKESFCFYNNPTLGPLQGILPNHAYGFSYNFNMLPTEASSSKANSVKFVDGEIFLTFRPTTFDNFFGTTSKLPANDPDAASGGSPLTGSVFIQNFWRGGQIASGSTSQIINADYVSKKLNQRKDNRPTDMQSLETSVGQRAISRSNWAGSNLYYRSGSGLGEGSIEVTTATSSSIAHMTPVVLFPTDELVFGIDSGLNANMKSYAGSVDMGLDQDVLAITGSRLIIKSGDAKITLYGSSVREGREVLPNLNQYLGSDAVHETISEVGPHDEFDILDKRILSASYVDGIFSGSLLSTGRYRVKLASSPKKGFVTGSLQRNVRFIDSESFYYDTFIPASDIIVNGMQNTVYGKNDAGENAVKMTATVGNGWPVSNNRNSNTLLSRPFTFERDSGQSRQRNVAVSILSAVGAYLDTYTGDQARFALYYNGNNPYVKTNLLAKTYQGAASLRYGLLNVRLSNPSAVFRRDKFGNFRDMLEQTRSSKIVTTNTGKDVVGLPAVTALFVSQSSDLQISPESTQCSNLSIECTSSLPFIDDGIVHNRGALPAVAVKFGPNNLIFGITGSFGF